MKDYYPLFSSVSRDLKPSGIRKFFSIAEELPEVISLGVGEPDYMTPAPAREAAIRSLNEGKTKYTANAGIAELRKEITVYLKRRFGMEYAPEQTVVTVGGSEAIDLFVRAFVNPGDEVLLPEPSFVAYDAITRLAGGVPVSLVTKEEDDFRLTPEVLKAAITPKTKLLVLPYPCNPTGGIMKKADLEAIANVLRGTNIMVLSDEIYAELTYGDEKHVSISQIDGMYDRTVVVNGFSKAYAMTGWRLGFAVGPAPVIELMNRIHQYALMCAPTTAQYAAIEALRKCDDDIAVMKADYDSRRRMVVDRLNAMGLHCFNPLGAFYVFPSIQSTGLNSQDFCNKLVYGKGVAVVPGDAFGACGDGFVRICYCYSREHLTTAMDRMEAFVQELK